MHKTKLIFIGKLQQQFLVCMSIVLTPFFQKLMVSHDLLRSTVTNQIAFDQRDSKTIFDFERSIDRCCQALESHFFSDFHNGNLGYHHFN